MEGWVILCKELFQSDILSGFMNNLNVHSYYLYISVNMYLKYVPYKTKLGSNGLTVRLNFM